MKVNKHEQKIFQVNASTNHEREGRGLKHERQKSSIIFFLR